MRSRGQPGQGRASQPGVQVGPAVEIALAAQQLGRQPPLTGGLQAALQHRGRSPGLARHQGGTRPLETAAIEADQPVAAIEGGPQHQRPGIKGKLAVVTDAPETDWDEAGWGDDSFSKLPPEQLLAVIKSFKLKAGKSKGKDKSKSRGRERSVDKTDDAMMYNQRNCSLAHSQLKMYLV